MARSQDDVKNKLVALGLYTDDILVEYVMVMLHNQKAPEEVAVELNNVLNEPEQIQRFVEWLFEHSAPAVQAAQPVAAAPVRVQAEAPVVRSKSPERKLSLSERKPLAMDATQPRKSVFDRLSGVKPERPEKPRAHKETTFVVTLRDEAVHGSTVRSIETGEELVRPEQLLTSKKPMRCVYWPACKNGDACEYLHPTELCRNFTNCQYGDRCLYIHPANTSMVPCKFGPKCTNANCLYAHPSGPIRSRNFSAHRFSAIAKPGAKENMCRNGADCASESCPFMHPSSQNCRFGAACVAPGCKYRHPLSRPLPDGQMTSAPSKLGLVNDFSKIPCRFQATCNRPDCKFLHHQRPQSHVSDRVYAIDGHDQSVPIDQAMGEIRERSESPADPVEIVMDTTA